MLRAPEGANRQMVNRYMRRHKIKEVIEKMLTDVIYGCPEDPLQRMVSFLESVRSGEILVESSEAPRSVIKQETHMAAAKQGHAAGSPVSTSSTGVESALDSRSMQQLAAFDNTGSGAIPGTRLCEALAAIGIYIAESDACMILETSSLDDVGEIPLDKVQTIARKCMQSLAKPEVKWMLAAIDFHDIVARKLSATLRISNLTQLGQCSKEALMDALDGADALIAEEILQSAGSTPQGDPVIQAEEANAKFAATEGAREGAYGSMVDFMKGLDAYIGLPNPKVEQAMMAEHLRSEDSRDMFTTSNYGGTTTCAATEWEFVVSPDPSKKYPGMEGAHAREPRELSHFVAHATAEAAGLTAPELVALRLYTGPMYMKYNAVLRRFPERMVQSLRGNRYVTTIHALVSGIIKLSQVWRLPDDRKVFRGLGGLLLPHKFWEADAYGCKGGVEYGVMSTTTSRMVAAQYSGQWGTGARQTVLEVDIGQVDRGASLKFLSQYPAEEEIVFPPLSNLELIGQPRVEMTEKGEMLVVQMRVNVNLKSKTMEELVANRQQLQVSMVQQLLLETKRELGGSDDLAVAAFQSLLEAESAKPAEWFNDDQNLIASMSAAMDMKTAILERHRLVLEAENKLLGRRKEQRCQDLRAAQQRLEEDERALIGFVEANTGAFLKQTLTNYKLLEARQTGAGIIAGEGLRFFAQRCKEELASVMEGINAAPTDPNHRNGRALLQRLVAQVSVSPIGKFFSSIADLLRAMEGRSSTDNVLEAAMYCPHMAPYVSTIVAEPQCLEEGGWTAAIQKKRRAIEAALAGQEVVAEDEQPEDRYGSNSYGYETERPEPKDYRAERDEYLRKALAELPKVAICVWRHWFPLHLYNIFVEESLQVVEDAEKTTAEHGEQLDTGLLAAAFDQRAEKAWQTYTRHQKIMAEISGVEQELREAPGWIDLNSKRSSAFQAIDEQVAAMKARIDAETEGLASADDLHLGTLPDIDDRQLLRPWLIPRNGGTNRRFLDWAAAESREVAEALEERRSLYLQHAPVFEDRRRRELLVLAARFHAAAKACRPEILALVGSQRRASTEAGADLSTYKALREFWDKHKCKVQCERHPEETLVRSNKREGSEQSSYDVCEGCNRLLGETTPRWMCLAGLSMVQRRMGEKERETYWSLSCRRVVCEGCHFLRSRCKAAFKTDASEKQEHDKTLLALVRAMKLTRSAFRGTEDARYEGEDLKSSAELHGLSQRVVAATERGEGEQVAKVVDSALDVVRFAEESALGQERKKVLSLLESEDGVQPLPTLAVSEISPEQAHMRIQQTVREMAVEIRRQNESLQQLLGMKEYIRMRSLEEHRQILFRKGVEPVVLDKIREAPLLNFCRKEFVRRMEGVVDLVARLGNDLPWLEPGDAAMDSEAFKDWLAERAARFQTRSLTEEAATFRKAYHILTTNFGNAGWSIQDADEAMRCGWFWNLRELPKVINSSRNTVFRVVTDSYCTGTYQDLQDKLKQLGMDSDSSDSEAGFQLYGAAWRQKVLMPSKDPSRLQKDCTWVMKELSGEQTLSRRSVLRVLELAELGMRATKTLDLHDGKLWQGCVPPRGFDDNRDPAPTTLEEAFWLGGLCPNVEQVGDINVTLLAGKSAEAARVVLAALPPLELNFVCGLLHWTRSDVAVVVPQSLPARTGEAPATSVPPETAGRMLMLSEMVAPGGRLDCRFQRCLQRQTIIETQIRPDGGYSSYGHFASHTSTEMNEMDLSLLAAMLRLPCGAGLRERSHRAGVYALQQRMHANARTEGFPLGRGLDRLHLALSNVVRPSALRELLHAASFSVAEITLELEHGDDGLHDALREGISAFSDLRRVAIRFGLSEQGAVAVAAAIESWGPVVGSRRMHPREGCDIRGFELELAEYHSCSKQGASALVAAMLTLAQGLGEEEQPEQYSRVRIACNLGAANGIDTEVHAVMKKSDSADLLKYQKFEEERPYLRIDMPYMEASVHEELKATLQGRVEYHYPEVDHRREFMRDNFNFPVAPPLGRVAYAAYEGDDGCAPPTEKPLEAKAGVGLVLSKLEDGTHVVKRFVFGQAAEMRAEIAIGDILTHVDGLEVLDVPSELLQDQIAGPEGTSVRLSLRKPSGEECSVELRRGGPVVEYDWTPPPVVMVPAPALDPMHSHHTSSPEREYV